MTAPALTIAEGLVDKRIKQAVDFSKGSDTSLKYACIAASPIVGTYSHATKMIAEQRSRSVSTVENWAHAHWLYRDMRREVGNKKEVRNLWRELPASHWWLAYDIRTKGYDALYYLALADAHNWSGRDMMQEYKKDMEAGNAPMVLHRVFVTFRGLADELSGHMVDLTLGQAAAVQAVQKAFA